MRISRLSIKNFRNFRDFNVRLSPGVVIVGENRVGKSNLLYAMRLVLDQSLPNSDRFLGREDFWDGPSRDRDIDPMKSGETIEISLEIVDFEDEPSVLAALAAALIEGEPMKARLTYHFGPRLLSGLTGERGSEYGWWIYGGEDYENRLSGEIRDYLHFVFLHALRDVQQDINSWRRSPLRELLEAAASEAEVGEFSSIIDAITTANSEVAKLGPISALGQNISARTQDMVGLNQALETELGVATLDPARLIRGLRLFVDGDARRALSTTSLGTLNVLYFALLELRLDQRLAKSDIAHVTLGIEEPEAHLHPHLQRLIFGRLLGENSKHQTTIVTTHSPHIASVASPRNLIALRKYKGETLAAVAANADLKDRDWEDIQRYLDATRAEMVFARRVLLVEGYAEQLLVPIFASYEGLDLDKAGISVCAIYGVHFEPYIRLCKALGIPWSVITDSDVDANEISQGEKRVRTLMERLGMAGDAESNGIFLGESTLEYDIFTTSQENKRASIDSLLQLATSSRATQTLSGWDESQPDLKSYLAMIKRVGGKGRFAQRLASQPLAPPSYISRALSYLEQA